MSSFANQLKSEISRLAKKEVRAETQALKKASAQYRSEIAALKRRVAGLEAQIKKQSKGAARAKPAENADEESGTSRRFRVAGFAALRKKLNISAAEMGKLLGVSAQSVYHWETGKTKPCRRPRISTAAKLLRSSAALPDWKPRSRSKARA